MMNKLTKKCVTRKRVMPVITKNYAANKRIYWNYKQQKLSLTRQNQLYTTMENRLCPDTMRSRYICNTFALKNLFCLFETMVSIQSTNAIGSHIKPCENCL